LWVHEVVLIVVSHPCDYLYDRDVFWQVANCVNIDVTPVLFALFPEFGICVLLLDVWNELGRLLDGSFIRCND
jgi:hypothetical protein